LNLSSVFLVSNFAFKFNLYRYAAANHIRKGEADIMIAGGVEAPIIPVGRVGYHFSPRYFAVETPVDDSQYGPCNQSDPPLGVGVTTFGRHTI
jgi:acetyl-CoA acetyltransferase